MGLLAKLFGSEGEPTLAQVVETMVAHRRCGAAALATREQFNKGETWIGNLHAREHEAMAAATRNSSMTTLFEQRRKSEIKPLEASAAAAAQSYSQEVEAVYKIGRDAALTRIEAGVKKALTDKLDSAVAAEADPAVKAHLARTADLERERLAALELKISTLDKKAAAHKAQLPELAKAADAAVAALAL